VLAVGGIDGAGGLALASAELYDPATNSWALAAAGAVPYAAWQETSASGTRVHVAHWDGAAWVSDGGDLRVSPAAEGAAPALLLRGAVPYVSWYEQQGVGAEVHVAHWTGTAWQADGPALVASPAAGAAPWLEVHEGTLYVGVRERQGGAEQLLVKHLGAAGWVQDGGGLNAVAGRDAVAPGLVFVGATPFAAWAESNGATHSIYVKALE
jgi:hypothetical protein